MDLAKFDVNDSNQHFAQQSQEIRQGPLPYEKRSCNDVCCVITFVLMMIAALVIGAIMISDGKSYYNQVFGDTGSKNDMTGLANVFSTQGGIIVGMFFFSLALAILYMFLLKTFPKCVVYTMIVLIYAIFIALIILGIINQIWWMVITFGITLLLISCMLWCFWDQLKTGIVLLKIAATFLSEKPSAYLAPLYPLFFGIIFFVFWVAAMVAELYWLSLKT